MRQDALAEALYYGSVKTVEKSLSLLLTAKAKALGDNVIPRGEVAEVTATCCASVAALTRVLYLFEERSGKGVRPLELVSVRFLFLRRCLFCVVLTGAFVCTANQSGCGGHFAVGSFDECGHCQERFGHLARHHEGIHL